MKELYEPDYYTDLYSKYKNLLPHIEKYGEEGAIFYSDLVIEKNKLIKFHPKQLKYPVYLRNNTSDIPTLYQVFYEMEYDIDYKFEPKVIVDCGANIGLAAVYFKNRFSNSKIISIEPEKSNFDLLYENTKNYENIHLLQRGIWNKDTNLKIENIGLGHWGFVTTETEEESRDTIKSISIDSIMEKYNLDHIDILKIDIEGSEKELFESNYDWMDKVNCIFIELHDRFKEGCTDSFNNAISNKNFSVDNNGENIILFRDSIIK